MSWQSPVDYRQRAPLHADISTNPLTWKDSQYTFDNELLIAGQGGIDYFAYLKYQDVLATNMNQGLKYHMASDVGSSVKFCLIRQSNDLGNAFGGRLTIKTLTEETVYKYFLHQYYYYIAPNQPLLYIYIGPNDIVNWWNGSNSNFAAAIAEIRRVASRIGLTPFIVSMGPGSDLTSLNTFGVDAVTSYARVATGTAAPYSTLTTFIEGDWTTGYTAGKMVPLTMSGWDPSPSNQHPIGFYSVENNSFAAPTVAQLATHLTNARNFIKNNPSKCPIPTILTYSWSEYSENGGVIGPSLGNPSGLAAAFNIAKANSP